MEDVGVAHLTVHQISPVDSGKYTCEVTADVIDTTGQRTSKTIISVSEVTVTGTFINLEILKSTQCLFCVLLMNTIYYF